MTPSLTGDASATLTGINGGANVSATATLANSGVTAGAYGSGTAILPNCKRKRPVTAVTTTAPTTQMTVAGDSGS